MHDIKYTWNHQPRAVVSIIIQTDWERWLTLIEDANESNRGSIEMFVVVIHKIKCNSHISMCRFIWQLREKIILCLKLLGYRSWCDFLTKVIEINFFVAF